MRTDNEIHLIEWPMAWLCLAVVLAIIAMFAVGVWAGYNAGIDAAKQEREEVRDGE